MIQVKKVEPVVLMILDGWGIAPDNRWNAISLAQKPNFIQLEEEFGSTELCASGTCVGLSEGQMGNSEVGHLTIGAGRIIFQDLMRVHEEVRSGRLAKKRPLLWLLRRVKRRKSTLHLLGLVSDGGVHSHIEHLFALLKIAKDKGVSSIAVHAILDGRDTPPKSGIDYVASLNSRLHPLRAARVATVAGRYYAMDRDNRWDRTKLAYDAIVYGEGKHFRDALESIRQSYYEGVTDEFVVPRVIGDYRGIVNGDALVFFNFRPDRARQLTKALVLPKEEFDDLFDRREERRPKDLGVLTMIIYDTKLRQVKSILNRERVLSTLGNVLEKNSVPQLRIAETEKYAHVTYFFNGLVEKPRALEDRILVPSLKIGTYDKKPQMSAAVIAHDAVKAMASEKYGFILVNFANADMVGHSGNVEATVRAIETVDECLGRIVNAWKRGKSYLSMFITADHGNAEKMYDDLTGQPHTAHTSNPVPLFLLSERWRLDLEPGYAPGLIDIAPSVLKIMGLEKPKAMTGRSIVAARS